MARIAATDTRRLGLRGAPMSVHPAQVRDAIQLFIEQAYRPVGRFHVQKAVTDRLDTYMGSQLRGGLTCGGRGLIG